MPSLAERLGYAEDAKLLILNCDDLGFCHAANVGVYQALRDGLATSASLMVPCPWARGAAAGYRGEDVGVHLTVNAEYDLYRWGPITHAPSLLDGDGGFPRTVEDVWDHADLDEVRRECRAQIERAILWGFDVSHLDAHMGTMQIRSEFFDVYLDLAVEFRLPLRLSGADTERHIGFPFRALAAEEGVVFPDDFVYVPGVGQPPDPPRRHRRAAAGRDRGLPAPGGGQPRARGHGDRLGGPGRRPPAARRTTATCASRSSDAGVTLIGYRPLRDLMRSGPDRVRPTPARAARRPADQNSVIAAISAWSCLYSGELVMGSSDMTLAMLPVTFTLPCMKAALASSSPFWILRASA